MAILPGLQWTTSTPVIAGEPIVEVDMRRAGMTIIERDKLLPESLITKLRAMPKRDSAVAIGKLSRHPDYDGLSRLITEGIRDSVENMLRTNEITADSIVSVKRDAVFIRGRTPRFLSFTDGTRFAVKNSYSGFAKLGTVEVYASIRKRTVDLKGISDELAPLHREFIVEFALDVLGLIAASKHVEAAETIQQFRLDYVKRLLPGGFYREFNGRSAFAVRSGNTVFQFDGTDPMDVNVLEIGYNHKFVIGALAAAIA